MWSLNILLLFVSSWTYTEATEKNWDFLIFTQHWPVTFCEQWVDNKPAHSCIPRDRDTWLVHGIWPTMMGTKGPEFCNKTWLFDPEQVRPIEDKLEKSWPNLEAGTPLYDLWAHEWNKHGTCAAELDNLNNEMKYFSKGLEWLDTYSMSNILSEADIVPSNTSMYSIHDFHRAITNKLGVEPEIQCVHEHNQQRIFELRICFSKSLELMDCKEDQYTNLGKYLTNCNYDMGITYPKSEKPPNRTLVQLYKLTTWLQWFTL